MGKSAVLISGLVTFIAAYHYIRIFNSWVESYKYSVGRPDPELTGVPFNDAYRYMDWLLTVPLLLIEILLVMKLDAETYSAKAKTLGVGSALMIISGYYGELTVTGDLTPRWTCWFVSMCFFLNIVYELLVGLSAAKRGRPGDQRQNPICAGDDGDQLVHLPDCVPLPDAWDHRIQSCGGHPDRLLRLGYHFQVRCRPRDLPGLLCQVEQGRGLAWLSGLVVAPADQVRGELGCGSDSAAGERDLRLSTHGLTGPSTDFGKVPLPFFFRHRSVRTPSGDSKVFLF